MAAAFAAFLTAKLQQINGNTKINLPGLLIFAVGASGEGNAVSRRRRMVKGNERIQKIVKENGRKGPESGKKVAI